MALGCSPYKWPSASAVMLVVTDPHIRECASSPQQAKVLARDPPIRGWVKDPKVPSSPNLSPSSLSQLRVEEEVDPPPVAPRQFFFSINLKNKKSIL